MTTQPAQDSKAEESTPEQKPKDRLTPIFQAAAVAGQSLATVFRIVAIYVWPFAARWQKPFSWQGTKKRSVRVARGVGAFAGLLLLHQLLQSGTALLFPTAEEYLQSQGLDPGYAQQLSDKEIRVRSRNVWGTLHALNDLPTILGIAYIAMVQSTPEQAYAISEGTLPLHEVSGYFNVLNQCRVLLEDKEKTTARSFISLLSGIPEDEIENVPVSDKEMSNTVAFHEFAHCSSKNDEEPGLGEMDADARGVWLAAEALNNPEIIRVFLYTRAMSTRTNSHDTALYLDAKMRREILPTAYELITDEPTNDAFALARLYERNHMGDFTRPAYIRKAEALKAVLKQHADLLSPMAKRRAELYIEAVEYFVPTAAGVKPQPVTENSVPRLNS